MSSNFVPTSPNVLHLSILLCPVTYSLAQHSTSTTKNRQTPPFQYCDFGPPTMSTHLADIQFFYLN